MITCECKTAGDEAGLKHHLAGLEASCCLADGANQELPVSLMG